MIIGKIVIEFSTELKDITDNDLNKVLDSMEEIQGIVINVMPQLVESRPIFKQMSVKYLVE